MLKTVRYIFKKELIHTLRDKKLRIVIFMLPILQLIVFGFAATFDVKNIRLLVIDRDHTTVSREVSGKFVNSIYFKQVFVEDTELSPETVALDRDIASAVLVIPKGFSKNLEKGYESNIQILVDGTNSNSATIIQNYVEIIVSGLNQIFLQKRLQKVSFSVARTGVSPLTLSGGIFPALRIWYNEELEAKYFMVPAVFAMVLFVITILLTSMALTRERELGTYEQLIVSPLKPQVLIIGKTIPFALVGLVQVTLILVASWLVFDVTVSGSIWLFYFSSLIFLITSLSFGILVSSICNNMQQAMMTTFMLMFPMMILSGMMVPIENMPLVFQWLTLLNPLRYFMEITRGLFLKGAGIDFLFPRLLVLFVFGLVAMVFAARGFRKTLQ